MTLLRAGSATDVGLVRANNQDQMLLASPIFAVADGMGGHAAGEVASRIAVDALRTAFEEADRSPEGVLDAARSANRSVWDAAQADEDLRGMGTTLTAIALVSGHGGEQLAIVNVGDSRTYHLRRGHLVQITVDHSYVAELVAEGRIDESEAEIHPQRHVLTRALGISPDVDIDLLVRTPVPGDRYLLCSDGLSREVTDDQVASTLRRVADPGEAARELVAAAKIHGGSDNITVVVVDVVADEPDTAAVAAAAVPLAAPPVTADGVPQGDPSADDGGPPTQVVPTVAPDGPGASQEGPDGDDRSTRPGDEPEAPVGATRRERRRAAGAAHEPRARLVTVRVVAFFALLVAIVVVAAFGTEYYARSTYYVGLDGGRVTIFQGRPGGVLWWKPTVSERTALVTSTILPYHLAALRSGVQETSLTTARDYVSGLVGDGGASIVPSSTVPPTPTTVTPTTVPA